MTDLEEQILAALQRKNYQPIKPKALARRLGVSAAQYADFRRALKTLIRHGRAEMGKNHAVRPAQQHGAVTGIFRRTSSGFAFVRTHPVDCQPGPGIRY